MEGTKRSLFAFQQTKTSLCCEKSSPMTRMSLLFPVNNIAIATGLKGLSGRRCMEITSLLLSYYKKGDANVLKRCFSRIGHVWFCTYFQGCWRWKNLCPIFSQMTSWTALWIIPQDDGQIACQDLSTYNVTKFESIMQGNKRNRNRPLQINLFNINKNVSIATEWAALL